jgi:small nuclear ribonucleoprotein (snRNP)-like protein
MTFRRNWEERGKLTSNTVIGTLKGYDQLMNLVLDEVKEALTGMHHSSILTSVANPLR